MDSDPRLRRGAGPRLRRGCGPPAFARDLAGGASPASRVRWSRRSLIVSALAAAFLCTSGTSIRLLGQGPTQLPVLLAAEMPRYPADAREVRISLATLSLRIWTNGSSIARIYRLEPATHGPLWAAYQSSAEANLATWKFADHSPTSFDVTFRFRLSPDPRPCATDDNLSIVMRPPTDVEVTAQALAVDGNDCVAGAVTAAALPFYPPGAAAAGVEGRVRVRVDLGSGQIMALDGRPELGRDAERIIRTWRFETFDRPSVDVGVEYRLRSPECGADGRPFVAVRFPLSATVSACKP